MRYEFEDNPDRRGSDSQKWAKYAGRDVLPMWVADMDFASPPEVLEALRRRIDHGVFGYADPLPSLAAAVVDWCSARYGWTIDPGWIVWLPGVVPGLNVAARAFAGEGDEVLCCTPVYRPFRTAPVHQSRRALPVPLTRRDGRAAMDLEAMAAAVTPRTKAFFLCHPHNPVGRAFTPREIADVVAFCRARGLVLVSDEIHCDLVLDDVAHVPAAACGAEAAAVTVTLMSPSKTFNLSGLGCAYAIIPDPGTRAAFARAARGIVPDPALLALVAAEAALRHGEPWRLALLDHLRSNRDFLETFVRERLDGVRMDHVEATYLAWLDVSGLGARDVATRFEEHGVGLSDGVAFAADEDTRLRLNFGCSRATLEEACVRMERAVSALRERG